VDVRPWPKRAGSDYNKSKDRAGKEAAFSIASSTGFEYTSLINGLF
jgi:hypothetical protein